MGCDCDISWELIFFFKGRSNGGGGLTFNGFAELIGHVLHMVHGIRLIVVLFLKTGKHKMTETVT